MTNNVVFVDTETTGLDPIRHQIWEVGLINSDDIEHRWFLPVDLAKADLVALNIGRYHERHPYGHATPWVTDFEVTRPERFAEEFAKLTWGKHLAGAVVSFDAERLARLLRANGQCPGWHYHLIDVEALAVGYIAGCRQAVDDVVDTTGEALWAGTHSWHVAEGHDVTPPWKSDQLTETLGITVDDMDKHTALGDARWAKAIYDKVMGA